jgi:hypothetical protein
MSLSSQAFLLRFYRQFRDSFSSSSDSRSLSAQTAAMLLGDP